jgi:hypothetical protein
MKSMDLQIAGMKNSLQLMQQQEGFLQKQYAIQAKQWGIQKQMFDLQTGYQREDFNKQQARMDVKWGWQQEDFAWNRESFHIQSGWELEDLQRALRYASSGRERMDIRRQIERQSIMNDRKETEMDRAESRAGAQHGWDQEDLDTAKRRFEEMRPLQEELLNLQKEQFELSKEQAEAGRAFQMWMLEQQIALAEQRKTDAEWQYGEQTRLGDLQREQEKAEQQFRLEQAKQALEEAKRREAEYQRQLTHQREMEDLWADFNMAMQLGFKDAADKSKAIRDYWEAVKDYAQQVQEWFGDGMPNISSYGTQGMGGSTGQYNTPQPIPAYAGGGPVNRPQIAMIGDTAGEEYVVPQNGALVIRERDSGGSASSAEVVVLLAAILSQLQEGGGTILIDEEKLKRAGFLHAETFDRVYR